MSDVITIISEKIKNKTTILVIVFTFLLVTILGATFFLTNNQPQSSSTTKTVLPQPSNQPSQKASASSPPPSTLFQTYTLSSSMPTLPSSIKTYTFQTVFKEDEVKAFAQKLGLSEKQGDTYFNLDDMYKRGMMTFDKTTGSFSFQSYGVLKPQVSVSGQSPIVTASSYLTYLFPDDPTLSCSTTYQKKETEAQNITYVECHRDWTKTGGVPILNPVGVLNIKEEQKLSGLVLGSVDANTPSDPSIVATSNETDGKTRPNDFNTITFGIDTKGNKIVSIDSSLRWISGASSLSQADLVTPQEALTSFMSHSSDFALTIPAGSGSVDWDKVYKDNKAISKQATITDYLLTYLEKPQGVTQTYLTPMYVIRGVATLETGYTVRFIETLPATRNNLSFLSPSERGEALRFGGQVAGTTSSDSEAGDTGQKQGGFIFPSLTPTPVEIVSTMTPTPTLATGKEVPTPTQTNQKIQTTCKYSEVVKTAITLDLPGFGKVSFRGGASFPHTYFYDSLEFNPSSMDEIRDKLDSFFVKQYVIEVAREMKKHNITSFDSIDQVLNFFDEVNKNTIEIPNGSTEAFNGFNLDILCLSIGTKIPFNNFCSNLFFIDDVLVPNIFDYKRMQKVARETAVAIVDLSKQNKITEESLKKDIFPPEHFSQWIFYRLLPIQKYLDTSGCYITGNSPSLYFYPQYETKVSIQLPSSLSYSYPSAQENKWNVTAHPDGTVSSNLTSYSRLYYEYDRQKVQFNVTKGTVIENNLSDVTKSIRESALQLNLNEKETADLLTDIHNVLPDVKGDYVKVSLADEKEVDDKLPLTISPQPDHFYRIHFVLSPASYLDYLKSKLLPSDESFTPLMREGFTVVEVGGRVVD